MKVLSVGSDRNLFKEGSLVRERILAQSQLFEELHVVVFSRRGFDPLKLGDRVWIYPTNSLSRWFYVFDAIHIARRIGKVDWVTAQDPFESGLAAWRIARARNALFQLQLHTDFLSPFFIGESWLNRLRVSLAKFLLPKADRVRAVSRRIVESIKQAKIVLKRDPVILPVFVDVEALRREPIKVDLHQKYPQFEKIILMASRLSKEKRIDLAVEAIGELVRAEPRVGLLIVGSGPELEVLKQKVQDSRLATNVIFEPWTEDLPSYYKTADLFLLTSAYEGYGRTIIEALACGTPVVTTEVGIAREVPVSIASPGNLLETIKRELAGVKRAELTGYPFLSSDQYLADFKTTFSL